MSLYTEDQYTTAPDYLDDEPGTVHCHACGQAYDVGELHICPDDDTSEPLDAELRDEPGWEGGFADNH